MSSFTACYIKFTNYYYKEFLKDIKNDMEFIKPYMLNKFPSNLYLISLSKILHLHNFIHHSSPFKLINFIAFEH